VDMEKNAVFFDSLIVVKRNIDKDYLSILENIFTTYKEVIKTNKSEGLK